MNSNAPIGVFDSGIGGLTVVREIMRQIPNETIIYFGDTARVPYGNKSKETILKYSREITRFLISKGVKAIVIACNTASAFALEEIRKEINIPIIGVVKPGAIAAAAATHNQKVGVIGTQGTINSGIYKEFLSLTNPNIEVFSKACPLFVPLVEEGMLEDSVTAAMIKIYVGELTNKDIDTLVMGCTHYPLLQNAIRKFTGDNVTLVNPAYETARSLKEILVVTDLLKKAPTNCEHTFYVSDGADKFKEFANTILPCEVVEIILEVFNE